MPKSGTAAALTPAKASTVRSLVRVISVLRLLVPELQRRGLFHKDYEGATLRETLGLPIPRAVDWHAKRGR